eukprot:TRINITY_DN100623_c0_g1_i1.p1 TRINITY_DN100623_c0_g1~~TRINITY_DN100623_c0_g1_i1.p1  ORF type:complete len:507 (-),score=34.52 TRINITY_DN100623_c0_g1_i1:73-1593(-)
MAVAGLSRIQWEFDAGREDWQAYADINQTLLEGEYRAWESSGRNPGKRHLELAFGKHVYDVDLQTKEQVNRASQRKRKMRRLEKPLDSATRRLHEDLQKAQTIIAETQHELARLRRSSSSRSGEQADAEPLSILQDRLPIFRVRRSVPCFSAPSDSALRQADLGEGTLVLAINRHTVDTGVRTLWLELSSGRFIRENHVDLEACEGRNMHEQCDLLAEVVQQGRQQLGERESPACICPASSSPLAQQREYVARVSLSCCSLHGQSRVCVEPLPNDSPEFEFVHRAFQKSLVAHRLHYGSEEMAEAPKLEVQQILRIKKSELAHRYNLERKAISGQPEQGSVVPNGEYVVEDSGHGLVPSMREFFLWHGTRLGIAEKIEKDGFDPRRGGEVGKMFGVGTYLAENASKSDLYGVADRNANSRDHVHCIIFVKALLGCPHYTKVPMQSATKPPDDKAGVPYDSVTALSRKEGGCVDLREYVVYKPAQVLPLCRIVYRHLPECQCCRCRR